MAKSRNTDMTSLLWVMVIVQILTIAFAASAKMDARRVMENSQVSASGEMVSMDAYDQRINKVEKDLKRLYKRQTELKFASAKKKRRR